MKQQKITLIILGMVLLIGIIASFGIVSADRELSNMQGIQIEDFVAGSEVQANFSYDYIEGVAENVDDSPLIIQFNISSLDIGEDCSLEDCSVWRGDFEIDGYIERCQWNIFGECLFEKSIPLECSEASNQTIEHPIGSEPVTAKNGTFYCYNHSADLELDRNDNVFLNIKSDPALYPGDYELSAKMFYLNDTYPPIVEILNNEDFENVYYKSGNNIEVEANISDVNLDKEEIIGKIYWNESETKLGKNYEDELYYFSETLPDEIPEGNHTIEISARDVFGNSATDDTRLLIDETAPEIQLIEPSVNWSVYKDNLTIKANITDEKAGVDKQSARYRLRETHLSENGTITFICPEEGEGSSDCMNTGWKNLEYNESSKLFEKVADISELNSSGYWLDIKASDTLGNKGVLK